MFEGTEKRGPLCVCPDRCPTPEQTVIQGFGCEECGGSYSWRVLLVWEQQSTWLHDREPCLGC